MSWLTKFFKFREKSDDEIVKPFLDHMEDLRWTLIKMIVVQFIAMVVAFYFRKDLMHLLQSPLAKVDPALPGKLVIIDIAASFMISIELAFFTGIALAFPFHVYFVAEFVLPALTRRERKFLLPGIFASFGLFVGGVLISYKWLLPATIRFFWHDAHEMQFTPMWTWNAYFSFAAWLCFGFGLMCELPVVIIVLALLGFVSYAFLARTRPYAYTIILVMSAIIAPSPDPMTFIGLSIPNVVLYELCIWVVWFLERRKKRAEIAAGDFSG
jgi:sec-independent protein translocase protein TatC